MKIAFLLILLIGFATGMAPAQNKTIDRKKFFTDDRLIEMTLVADFKKLIHDKTKKDYKQNYQPATITCVFPDSTKVTEPIEIRSRGKYRREEFYMPPLMLNFKTTGTVLLKKLGRLKLVWPAGNNPNDEQLVLKEYLVYKIFNLLTEKSFRVRLVKMNYSDINEKIKSHTCYAFFIEDVDNMASRNNCEEVQSIRYHTERTNRDQTTLVSLFEYMIGNTDWAVPIYRNIKLMRNRNDTLLPPLIVPYDFDYCGLVNAAYAIPPSGLPIESVRERLYRGFPRTMAELKAALLIFQNQRQAMNLLITNFEPLSSGNKKEMLKYLDDFFELIEKEKQVDDIFIKNARVE